jgi:hypothetical protein
MKDKGSNLNAMTFTLRFVVSCKTLGLYESFNCICFGHVFFKACQYAIADEIFCKNFKYVSMKAT